MGTETVEKYYQPSWTIPNSLYEHFRERHHALLVTMDSLGNAVPDRSEEAFFRTLVAFALTILEDDADERLIWPPREL